MKQNSFTILTIEDDRAIRQGVVDALRFKGYNTLEAADGQTGLSLATSADYDLLLLDLALPKITGLDILKNVRELLPVRPVIILTAKGSEADRVSGLKLGADDYVVKPFSVLELLARIEAVLRRSPGRQSNLESIRFMGGLVDFSRREVRFGDERTELSEKEAELLHYLAAHSERAISRDELLASVWRLTPKGLTTRTIDMHIARLREKLRDNSGPCQVLVTVRGKGYKFQPATETSSL